MEEVVEETIKNLSLLLVFVNKSMGREGSAKLSLLISAFT